MSTLRLTAAAVMNSTRTSMQAPGQNFDVIGWKQFQVGPGFVYIASENLTWTQMPPDPTFVKQRSDTHLFVMCTIDFVSQNGQSCFHSIFVDGVSRLTVAMPGAARQLLTFSMMDLVGVYPAGAREIKLYGSINGGQGTPGINNDNCGEWRTNVCSMRIFEVVLPVPQA